MGGGERYLAAKCFCCAIHRPAMQTLTINQRDAKALKTKPDCAQIIGKSVSLKVSPLKKSIFVQSTSRLVGFMRKPHVYTRELMRRLKAFGTEDDVKQASHKCSVIPVFRDSSRLRNKFTLRKKAKQTFLFLSWLCERNVFPRVAYGNDIPFITK